MQQASHSQSASGLARRPPRALLARLVLHAQAPRWSLSLVAALFAALTLVATKPIADPDVWWVAAAGREMMAQGHVPLTNLFSFADGAHPWIMHEWLLPTLRLVANGLIERDSKLPPGIGSSSIFAFATNTRVSVFACLQLISSRSLSWRGGSPRSPLFSVVFRRTQPERNMRGLHRLLHHGQQVPAQLLQVDFLAQGSAERGHGLGGIILAAIEAPVNDPLDTSVERLE